MKFSVVYKKYSDLQKNVVLVQDVIEATTFDVLDGNLVLYGGDGPVLAVPAGVWLGIESAALDSDKSPLSLVN